MIVLNPFKTVILHIRLSHMASCLALAWQKEDSHYFCWLNQTGLQFFYQSPDTNQQLDAKP